MSTRSSLSASLPSWAPALRGGQGEAIRGIVDAYHGGARVAFLDAPTGAGKTLIAHCAMQELGARRTLYVCSSRSLQDQFVRDFPNAVVIKGRQNYPTLDYPNAFPQITCDDCNRGESSSCMMCIDDPSVRPRLHCSFCHGGCPYQAAKFEAAGAPLAVLNTHYFLAEANAQSIFGAGTSGFGIMPDLVIVDEADTLENVILSYAEVKVSAFMMRRLGIKSPDKKTVADSWQTWITDVAAPAVIRALSRVGRSQEVEAIRARKRLRNVLTGLGAAAVNNGNWVYTGYDRGDVIFKPLKVDSLAPQLLWRHGGRFLLMSASLISSHQIAASLGLTSPHATVTMPSSFPVARRPIILRPRANMSKAGQETDLPVMESEIRRIMETHPDERILVHTVSFDLAAKLTKALDDPRTMTYASSRERDAALARFQSTPGAVLIAASLDRGIDLPHDMCRVVVIAKVPFGNLGDKQVSARLHSNGGQTWYTVETIRTLVQMTGRGMRSSSDWCASYIVDKQFMRLYRENKHLFPRWWTEAIDFTGGIASLPALEQEVASGKEG